MPKYKITTTEGTLTIDSDSPENAQATAEEYLAQKSKSSKNATKQPETRTEQQQQLKPTDFPSQFRSSIGGYLPEIPPMLFGIGGNIAGGLLGAAAGGVGALPGAVAGGAVGTSIGELLKYSMQKSAPELFGGPSEQPFSEAAKNVSLNAILDTLAFGPGFLTKGKPIKDVLLHKLMGITPGSIEKSTLLLPETLSATEKAIQANQPITVGELTGKPLIEDVFARKTKQQMIRQAKIESTNAATVLTQFNKITAGERASKTANITAKQLKDTRNAAYDVVRTMAEDEASKPTSIYYKIEPAKPLEPSGLVTTTGQPILPTPQPPTITEVKVPGPINTSRTKDFLQVVKDSLTETLHGDVGELPPDAVSKLQNLESKLRWLDEEYVQNPVTFLSNPSAMGMTSVTSYHKATDIRQALLEVVDRDYLKGKNPRAHAAMKAMRETLDKDIEGSLATWSDPAATQAYKAAKEASNREASLLYNKLADDIRFHGKPGSNVTSEQMFDYALSDPELAHKYVQLTGNSGDLRGAYLKDLIISNFKDDKFVPEGALVKFIQDEQKGLLREFLSSNHISNLKQFFRESQIRTQEPKEAMATALQIRKYGMGLLALTGVGTSAITGDWRTGATVGLSGLSLIFGAEEFARRVLLNPKYTKIALEAMKAPVTSEAGKYYSRLLMGTMRGVTGMLQLPDGTEVEATVDKNGKVRIAQ